MNAPLRKDAVTGSLAQPRVTFRVRQRTEQMFDVLREMSGPDVQAVEEEFTSDPIRGEEAANDYAFHAAESFSERYPAFTVEVTPFPTLGRRPGQAYAEHPPERDPPPRLTRDDCLPKVCSPW
jgi:hypothetical protein